MIFRDYVNNRLAGMDYDDKFEFYKQYMEEHDSDSRLILYEDIDDELSDWTPKEIIEMVEDSCSCGYVHNCDYVYIDFRENFHFWDNEGIDDFISRIPDEDYPDDWKNDFAQLFVEKIEDFEEIYFYDMLEFRHATLDVSPARVIEDFVSDIDGIINADTNDAVNYFFDWFGDRMEDYVTFRKYNLKEMYDKCRELRCEINIDDQWLPLTPAELRHIQLDVARINEDNKNRKEVVLEITICFPYIARYIDVPSGYACVTREPQKIHICADGTLVENFFFIKFFGFEHSLTEELYYNK